MSRLLVVDDEPGMRETLTDILETAGHTVDVASNGVSALELLRAGEYDVVLMDVRMPRLDGVSVLQQMGSPPPQVILMTAYALDEQLEQAVEAEAYAIVQKPSRCGCCCSWSNRPRSRRPDHMFPDDYVLVVDDDDGIRETVVEILADAGIPAYGVGTGTAAVRAADNRPPLVAVVDHRLPDMTGIDVVNRLKETDPALPVVLVTGFATLETAINAVGVVDEYLTKPVRPDRIVAAVRAKLESRRLKWENTDLLGRLERANAELEQMLAARDAELEGVIDVASAVAGAGELEPVCRTRSPRSRGRWVQRPWPCTSPSPAGATASAC